MEQENVKYEPQGVWKNTLKLRESLKNSTEEQPKPALRFEINQKETDKKEIIKHHNHEDSDVTYDGDDDWFDDEYYYDDYE